MNRLKDRVCVVTGGGRGIGKSVSQRLLQEGAKVMICDIDGVRARVAAEDLSRYGDVGFQQADVRERSEAVASISAAVDEWGRLDIIVNNAAIARTQPFTKLSDEQWNDVILTNLYGTFAWSQEAAKRMIQQGAGGRIINIASTNGLRGQPLLADYGASKAGVINLSKTMAVELAKHDILVNVVCPGTIWTEMSIETGFDDDFWNKFRHRIPLQRFGDPEDIAAAVAYLASDDAKFVSGHVLTVDGALTAQQ